jgi:hypothetical protein
MPDLLPLHPVNREHLDALTGEFGIMQHAIGSRPDPAHGSCTDDVARALRVDLLHGRQLGWGVVADSAWRSVTFLDGAFDRSTGRFRNFRAADGSWLDAVGSQDSHGRALLALGEAIAGAPDTRLVESAKSLFDLALPAAEQLTALRASSSVVLACDAVIRSAPTDATADACRRLGERLGRTFLSPRTSPAWPWPQTRLTYENALPVRALLAAGVHLASDELIDAGLQTLDWLIAVQTAATGHLSPIGNTLWPRDGIKAQFDQQPIEATTLLLASELAYRITGEDRYRAAVEQGYGWFLGRNDLGVDVADPSLGAGFDGLTPLGVNTNQGAESTLMWLLALEHVRGVRDVHPDAARRAEAVLAAVAL